MVVARSAGGEPEQFLCVASAHFVDGALVETRKRGSSDVETVGPRRVGVRVVRLEHDVVDADAVEVLDAVSVGDETTVEVLSEVSAGWFANRRIRPRALVLPRIVDALEYIRNPADAAL